MARSKAVKAFFPLFLAVIFFGALGGAILLKVSISDQDINYTDDSLNYMKGEVSSVHRVNSTISNTGSVGCQYTLESVYSYGNITESQFSETKPLWQGAHDFFRSYNLIRNYTGEVNVTVKLHFCGAEDVMERFSFESTEKNTVPDKTIESTTLSSNRSLATIKVGVREGMMIPERKPATWKVPYSEIRNGRAVLDYSPEIFTRRENITYIVIGSQGEVLGTTKVSLRPEKSFVDSLSKEIFKVLLAFSIGLNILILWRMGVLSSFEQQFKRVKD